MESIGIGSSLGWGPTNINYLQGKPPGIKPAVMRTLFHHVGTLLRIANGVRELRDAYLVTDGPKIGALGPMDEAPSPKNFDEVIDCSGRIVLPGFVDSHTHVLYVGDRSDEFEMRLHGKSYQEIAALGGGIKKSVKQVREATIDQLVAETLPRVRSMLSHGTTTVEIKSGYGLSIESEIKMLEAIDRLKKETPVEIHATFLGAHDFPAGLPRETYLRQLTDEMIPEVARRRLAEFCDIFCDEGYFTLEETRRIARAAQGHGLKLKLHANELANSGGVEVAVEMEALSADHLLFLNEPQLRKLKGSSVIATLLPGTSFFLRLPYAPARQLIEAGVTVALATDANPGSCTITSMPLVQNIATTQLGMSPAETLVASTLNGAAALGISDRVGSLEVGKEADLIVTHPMGHYRELSYGVGTNPCWRVYKRGRVVAENS